MRGDTYEGSLAYTVDSSDWLKYSEVRANEETIEKEYKVSGLGELTEDMIWEGVSYEESLGTWGNYEVDLVIDNDYNRIDYEWTGGYGNNLRNGDEVEIIAYIDDEEIARKTIVMEGLSR